MKRKSSFVEQIVVSYYILIIYGKLVLFHPSENWDNFQKSTKNKEERVLSIGTWRNIAEYNRLILQNGLNRITKTRILHRNIADLSGIISYPANIG